MKISEGPIEGVEDFAVVHFVMDLYLALSERNKPSNEQKLEVEDFKEKRMRNEVAGDQDGKTGGPSLKKVQRGRNPSIRPRSKKKLADNHEDEAVKDYGDKEFDPKGDNVDEDFCAPVCGKSIAIKPLVPKILGILNGTKKVNHSKDIDVVMKEKFTNKGRGKNMADTMKQMQTGENKDDFIVTFMLVILALYLALGTNLCVNREYLPVLKHSKGIKEFNWCDHVTDFLVEGIKELRACKKENVNAKGFMYIVNNADKKANSSASDVTEVAASTIDSMLHEVGKIGIGAIADAVLQDDDEKNEGNNSKDQWMRDDDRDA
ncbi:hypothetical protein GUJ93_ZPchr0004g39279 [Zizania palustris]|uniref:Uncharacterized protein n=1 Tax=Zizania palustris TaxID=103762 RepID=A0A8J5SZU0_ZIZPA|nr:hypothetical protein GUJ93_ZPchr0004g39279 [Zizania palustris]